MNDMNIPQPKFLHIRMRSLAETDTLVGKSAALRDFPKLLSAIESVSEGATILLDFKDVEIATASYFGGTVATLIKMARNGQLDRYFLVAGLNRNCLDELKLVLEFQDLVALACEPGRSGRIHNATVIGSLDPSQQETFELVSNSRGMTASELHRQAAAKSDRQLGLTAWINRLTSLHKMGLLRREKNGREFVFRAIYQE